MNTKKMKMIEAYLNAKKGDMDKDVDETLVHRWEEFTFEDIREVACILTENDLKRFACRKYINEDRKDVDDFLFEFNLTLTDKTFGKYEAGVYPSVEVYLKEKYSNKKREMYFKILDFIRAGKVDKKTWTKFLKWYKQFGIELTYKDIAGKMPWEIITMLENTDFISTLHVRNLPTEHLGDIQESIIIDDLTHITEWFEANVEGYKEFED